MPDCPDRYDTECFSRKKIRPKATRATHKQMEASSKITVGAEKIERLVKHLDQVPAALLIAAAMRYPQEIWKDLPVIERAMADGKDSIFDLLLWYRDRALFELTGQSVGLIEKKKLQIFLSVSATAQ